MFTRRQIPSEHNDTPFLPAKSPHTHPQSSPMIPSRAGRERGSRGRRRHPPRAVCTLVPSRSVTSFARVRHHKATPAASRRGQGGGGDCPDPQSVTFRMGLGLLSCGRGPGSGVGFPSYGAVHNLVFRVLCCADRRDISVVGKSFREGMIHGHGGTAASLVFGPPWGWGGRGLEC